MTDYPYRAARYQYGLRKGTLGLALHMSEGYDNLVSYLAGNPARGVSANFALLSTGVMWRMTPYETASGSMNPNDRSTDKGYYGHSVLVDVLGDHWPDPNAWSISLEIAGFAAKGPNTAQVASIIRWAADMKAMFPTLRGAYGHADQTDTKSCPGTTAAMKAAFAGLGGHGLWIGDTMGLLLTYPPGAIVSGLLTIPKDANSFRVRDGAKYKAIQDAKRPAVVVDLRDHPAAGQGYQVDLNGDEAHFVLSTSVPPGSFVPTPSADCQDAVAAEHERTRNAAIAAVEAIA